MEYEHPQLRNLADPKQAGDKKSALKEEELTKLGSEVVEDFNLDWESSSAWRQMHADWLKLYYQQDNPQNAPWPGSSEESIPMLAEACNQFHSRAFREMFPSDNVVKAKPIGKTDSAATERAERVSRHMSWQLMIQSQNYKRNKDRLLLGLPLHGSVFTKTYFDPVKRRNVTENVRAIDLVVPYGTGPRDIEDLERKTQTIYLPMHKAAYLKNAGYFSDMPEPYGMEQRSEQDKAHDEVSGFSGGQRSDRNPAKLLEQHGFHDFDGDGVPEPYIVTTDVTTQKVLRIAIRHDTDVQGNPTAGKNPTEYFTHYPFMSNPDGFYGLGYGHLLGQINTAVNKMLRQAVDAGTLANVGNHSGFISSALNAKKGEVAFQLGKFITLQNSGEDINRGIFQFKFPGPQATLFNVIDLLMMKGDRVASVTEAITGQTEKVMQPTAILALIDQSLQLFSTVYERVLMAWAEELKIHYDLNAKYMDPEEYFAINDIGGTLRSYEVARKDYADDLQIRPVADPKMSTERQKMARAEAELQSALTNPLTMQSPKHLHAAYKRYYIAIGTENIDEILPDVTDQQLPRVDNPVQENMGALSPVPMMPAAFPDQDHEAHIEAHMALMKDPTYGAVLSDYGREELQNHIRAHMAFLYGRVEQQPGAMINGAAGIGPSGPGPGGMAPNAGNGGVLPGPAGPVPGNPELVPGGGAPGAPAPGEGPGD